MQENNNNTGVGTFIAVVAALGTAGLAFLHYIGARERGIEDRAQGLLARGQRAIGRNEDAAQTNAHRLVNNISAGAKVVADKAGESASTAAAVVRGLIPE